MKWTVDPVHSHVGFSVRHMMVRTVRGAFTSYSGTLELDPATPGEEPTALPVVETPAELIT